MGSKYLVVAGNGETTRINVEALMEDYFRGNSADFILVLPFQDRPSQGQLWAHQVAHSLDIPTTVIAPEKAIMIGFSSASITFANDPVKETVSLIAGEWVSAFFLWTDEDPFTVEAQEAFKQASVPCYDLRKGLLEISGGIHPKEPQKPQEEVLETQEEEVEGPVTGNNLPVIVSEDLSKAIGKAVAKAVTEVFEKFGISG